MVKYNDGLIGGENGIKKKRGLSEFIEGFLSEVFSLKEGDWETYENIKNKYLRDFCSSTKEYELACIGLATRLNI